MDLIDFSSRQKQVATDILKSTKILEVLSNYGECKVTGSYEYDLMYGPDIDIVVKTDNPRESSLKAIKELLELRQFQKYQYGDFEKFPRKNLPHAFIIVLILEIEGVRWEIEIWFLTDFTEENKYIGELMLNKLTPENKLAILKIKEERENAGDNKHKISSTKIYKEVMEKGVKSYSEITKE